MTAFMIARRSTVSFVCLLLMLALTGEALAAKKPKTKRKTKPAISATNPKYVFNIPYASPEAALAALEQRADVLKQDASPQGWQSQESWKIFNERPAERPGMIEWAFTPPGHAAHPSVIKRYFDVGSADHIYIDTSMKCSGDRAACKDLSGVIEKANWRIKKDNERHFVKEGDFLWKDTPSTTPAGSN